MLDDGRLGLIDYGQTKRLTPEQRLIVARIFLALSQHDGDRVVQYAWFTAKTNPARLPHTFETQVRTLHGRTVGTKRSLRH